MRQLTRLNQTSFVQDTYMYLNQATFLAQVASIGYYFWEWSKRRLDTKEEKEEEKVEEEQFEKEHSSENAAVLKPLSDEIRDPKKRLQELQTIIDEEKREALIQEQREAWILKLSHKRV